MYLAREWSGVGRRWRWTESVKAEQEHRELARAPGFLFVERERDWERGETSGERRLCGRWTAGACALWAATDLRGSDGPSVTLDEVVQLSVRSCRRMMAGAVGEVGAAAF